MVSERASKSFDKLFSDFVSEASKQLGSRRVLDALADILVTAGRAKATVDKNFDGLLALANIPSRRDLQRLTDKVDGLHGTLMNLSRKLEALRKHLEDSPSRKRTTKVSKASRAAKPAKKKTKKTRKR